MDWFFFSLFGINKNIFGFFGLVKIIKGIYIDKLMIFNF